MITSIIFSKDRPLQLDLCLKSIEENLKVSNRNIVIYKCSNGKYQSAYEELSKSHRDVEFWPQSKSIFKDIYHSILTESDNEFICFFVDDCIVYNNVYLDEKTLRQFQNGTSNFSCISLRLGQNICERSHEGVTFPDVPVSIVYSECGGWMAINKTNNLYGSYWSYSLSVDGHIFRKKDMEDMIIELWKVSQFKDWKQTPNEFESALQRFWTNSPPGIICPFQSAVVNSPNNKTQDSHPNRHGDVHSYNQDTLLDMFLSGKRIEIEKLEIKNVKCPHTEIDIMKGIT